MFVFRTSVFNRKGIPQLAMTILLSLLVFLLSVPGLWAQDDLFQDPVTPAPATKQTVPEAAPAESDVAAPAPVPAPSEAASDAPDGSNSAVGNNYLVWMIRSLGVFFTLVFAALSLAMVALVTMNILSIRRSSLVPEELVRDFGRCLDEQKLQEAYAVAKEDESLLAKVLASGMSRIHAGYEKAEQAMQDVMDEESIRLQHRVNYLALIGNLAPMIGLFGTVVGMIDSFHVISAGGAAPSPQKLAEGIATALFTTEIGLSIALPALAIYEILRNRLDRYLLEASIISQNFMSRFSGTQNPQQ